MDIADWTYELPPLGSPSVWLEGYGVFDAGGEPAGKVASVLDRRGERLLVVERSAVPLRHDLRALPFDAIRAVDHENTAVRLRLHAAEVEDALALDPAKGSESGGEARRVTEPPPEEVPAKAPGGAAGPVDNPAVMISASLVVLSAWGVLVGVAAYNAHPTPPFIAFFALPVAMLLAAAVFAWRWWAQPAERDAARRKR